MTKWVYNFGKLGTDGDSSMRNLLGGKGANLAEMSGIGLPVPPGFNPYVQAQSLYLKPRLQTIALRKIAQI